MPDKELVIYSRTYGCPFVTIAKRVLSRHNVPYREIFIDKDEQAKARVIAWTGFQSVPTMVIAHAGDIAPYEPVAPLPAGTSPRGIDRGAMLTEGNADEVTAWLTKHGFIRP
jgi:glutaredoxin